VSTKIFGGRPPAVFIALKSDLPKILENFNSCDRCNERRPMERFADHVRARIQQAYERGVAQPRVPDSCTTVSGGSLISTTAADAARGERDFLRHISGWTRAGDLSWASTPGDACRLHVVASASAQLLHTVKTSEVCLFLCACARISFLQVLTFPIALLESLRHPQKSTAHHGRVRVDISGPALPGCCL
jgi:hypothetical protein